jgi:signal transduction histidine kinase
MILRSGEPPLSEADDASGEASIDAWRRKATDVYSAVMAAASLPVAFGLPFLHRTTWRQNVLGIVAWLLVFGAAVVRRLRVRMRVWLMVAAVWMFAWGMLDRGGIFLNFRLPLIEVPLAVVILAGVRRGLLVGAVNVLFILAAVWATEAGLLPQAPPSWSGHEAWLQTVMIFVNAVPQLLLLAWFSHHLSTSIRREHLTAARLRAEAAERQRLENAVMAAGEQASRRIGDELHDGVCQDLTGLLLQTKRAQKTLAAEERPEAQALQGIVEGLGDTIGEIHGLSRNLNPGWLTERDLAGAIDDLVRRSAEVADAEIVFRAAGGAPGLDAMATSQLFRIAQEAIANAIRHSGARRIEVLLAHEPSATILRVDDDGRGFPRGFANRQGLGLKTMSWRAAKVGGALTVGPRPEGGVRVECRLPFRASNKEAERET